jgi:hypothetical protein
MLQLQSPCHENQPAVLVVLLPSLLLLDAALPQPLLVALLLSSGWLPCSQKHLCQWHLHY